MGVRELFDLHRPHGARHRRLARARPADGRGARASSARASRWSRARPTSSTPRGAHLRARYGARDPVVLPCDLADADAIAPMVERPIAALGPIDILVNNAGATWGAATVELPLAAWNKVIDLNLTATFLVTQEVGRRCMVPRRRGKVINIASILGLVGGGDPSRPATLAYNTSKGGIVNFTRSLAAEWAQHDINVNAIAPGFFPTKMTQGRARDDRRRGGAQGAAAAASAAPRT